MSKILVSGGCGFMGSHLVDALLKDQYEVTVVDNLSGGRITNLGQIRSRKRLTFINADTRGKDLMANIVPEHDVIFHLAAYAAEGQSVFSPIEINDNNIRSMNSLLVAAVNSGVKRFIFTSSMAVYGEQTPPFSEEMPRNPVDPYGFGKAYCEQMLECFSKVHGLDYMILRPHNVFGERQNISDPYRNVIGIWMNMMMKNKRPIIYGNGNQTRAFSYIDNIIPPMVNAMKSSANQIVNLGGGKFHTINEMFRMVSAAMDYKGESLHYPDRPAEVKNAFCTTAKSREILGYRDTFSVEAGIMRMAEWAKKLGGQTPSYRVPLEILKNAPETWRDKLI